MLLRMHSIIQYQGSRSDYGKMCLYYLNAMRKNAEKARYNEHPWEKGWCDVTKGTVRLMTRHARTLARTHTHAGGCFGPCNCDCQLPRFRLLPDVWATQRSVGYSRRLNTSVSAVFCKDSHEVDMLETNIKYYDQKMA